MLYKKLFNRKKLKVLIEKIIIYKIFRFDCNGLKMRFRKVFCMKNKYTITFQSD